jgi:GNAT domain-containint protein/DNA adenine methylase-like protein
MMPSPASVLFPTVTESPAREFIAAQLAAAKVGTLILPAAGRFATAAAAAPVLGAGNIRAYDTALLPTLIGWLADPSKQGLSALNVTVPDHLRTFVDGAATDLDTAAGIMAAVKYASLPKGSAYMAEQARAVKASMPALRAALAARLGTQVTQLAGLTYQAGSITEAVTEVIARQLAEACIVIDFHGLKAHSRAAQLTAEAAFWDQPPDPFDPRDTGRFLEELTAAEPLVICYVPGDKHIPPGWVRLAAAENSGSTDYVIANRDPGARLVKTRKRPRAAVPWPLFAEQEITPASEIGMVCVDKDTALHYRDVMAHRLAGSTVSERYYLCLVDGRVISVLGLHFRDFVVGKTDLVSETFGLSITSGRYARLGKLMMLALTSAEMRVFLIRTSPGMLSRNPPAGIATSSPTLHEEGKGSGRGVMKLVRREPRPGGGFDLRYEALFRDDTWAQVVAAWHTRYAHICRPEWDGPRLPAPAPHNGGRNRNRRRRHPDQEAHSG